MTSSVPVDPLDHYERHLRAYLARPDEERLAQAYETGREALAAGVGLIALTDLHGQVMVRLLERPSRRADVAERAARFFREAMAPYEMAFRGYRDANRVLQGISDSVLKNLPAVIFTVTPDGRLLGVQGGGLEAMGLRDRDQLEGADIRDLVATQPQVGELFESALAGEAAYRVVYIAQLDRDLSINLRPLFDQEGALELVVGLALDYTERRRAEQALLENDAKSRFLANMSHELRNPLNVVIGFAQLLASSEMGSLSPRQQRYLTHIEQAGEALLALVNDALDISKVAAGQMTVNLEAVAIDPLIETSVEQMTPLAAARNVSLEASRGTGLVALADRQRLRQVLINLLSNAIKFTPSAGRVRIAASGAGDEIRVAVRDTGIGIPSDKLDYVFDEFAQIDSHEADAPQGTGLGLPLSRRLAELMGGRLEVTSKVGKGSTFTVAIPALRD